MVPSVISAVPRGEAVHRGMHQRLVCLVDQDGLK